MCGVAEGYAQAHARTGTLYQFNQFLCFYYGFYHLFSRITYNPKGHQSPRMRIATTAAEAILMIRVFFVF